MRMIKISKIISVLLALLVVVSAIPMVSVPVSAAVPDGMEFEIINREITITYCPDEYTTLEVPQSIAGYPVTSISAWAFFWCEKLESIVIPEGVTSIGEEAFGLCKNLKSIDLPQSLKAIGPGAFINCKALESIEIPEGVTTLEELTFSECTKLSRVVLSEGLETIGSRAFDYCTSLKSITIPSTVTAIGAKAFCDCKGLESITILSKGATVGEYAFSGCSGLDSVYIEDIADWCNMEFYHWDSNPVYYAENFYLNGAPLTDVVIPEGVTSIGSYAFFDCTDIESVEISQGVTSIGDSAFYGCSSLTAIDIPAGVTTIGPSAFYYCSSLERITMPVSVTSIGDSAFNGCSEHVTVYYGGIENDWNGISIGTDNDSILDGEIIFAKTEEPVPEGLEYVIEDGEAVITRYTVIKSELVIPETINGCPVTTIADWAFWMMSGLEKITIPKTVKTIGECGFYFCGSLKSITVDPENPVYHSVGDCLIETETGRIVVGCQNSVIPADGSVTGIYANAFLGCINLKSIFIPYSVVDIEDGAFAYCIKLESITVDENNPVYHSAGNCLIETEAETVIAGCDSSEIPSDGSVSVIGKYAFYGFYNLMSIAIPKSITVIEDSAFSDCTGLIAVHYEGSEADWNNVSIGEGNDYLLDATVFFAEDDSVPEGLEYVIEDGEVTITDYTGSATELVIPDMIEGCPVKYIGNRAFEFIYSLESVTIPEGVTTIGDYAFNDCKNLVGITLPDSLTIIGDGAFYSCQKLKGITLPDSVTSIGDEVFYRCYGIERITIPEGVTTISQYAFAYCTGLTSVTISEGVITISEGAFFQCTKLTSVIIPEGVTTIDDDAFNCCYKLANITIPDSVTTIGALAFSYCTKLTSITMPEGVTTIADNVFYGCNSLESIIIPEGVTTIGSAAFYGCSSLSTVYYCGSEADWNNISIGGNNEYLLNAEIIFDWVELLPGDVNGDGAVNSIDSNLLRRIVAGTIRGEDYNNGDVNGDGIVNSIDSNLVRRIVAGTMH